MNEFEKSDRAVDLYGVWSGMVMLRTAWLALKVSPNPQHGGGTQICGGRKEQDMGPWRRPSQIVNGTRVGLYI